MNEKNKLPAEEVNLNVGEVDVMVSKSGPKKDMFLPVSILIAAVMVGGAIIFVLDVERFEKI